MDLENCCAKPKRLSLCSQQTSLDCSEDDCNRGSGRSPPPLRVCTSVYTDVVQCSAVQCLCLWSTSALARYVHLCTRCVGVQWLHQMLIEYAAGLEGEGNKCLIHFFLKTMLNSKYFLSPHAFRQNSCNQVPCINTTNLQI